MGSVSAGFPYCPCFSRIYGHENLEFQNLRQGGRTVGPYVDGFSKLARYAPDDVATDAAKQEKFLEGLNDELSMQLMVASFNNYQELVEATFQLKGSSNRLRIARGSMDKGSTILVLSRSHVLPQNREDIYSIPMEEGERTIIMTPRMVTGMEEATARTVPTHQPHPKET